MKKNKKNVRIKLYVYIYIYGKITILDVYVLYICMKRIKFVEF